MLYTTIHKHISIDQSETQALEIHSNRDAMRFMTGFELWHVTKEKILYEQ